MRKKLVVLSGAGISEESGLKTFRDADGLWEGYDVMRVASLEGWCKNRKLVLDFYNERRRQSLQVNPNQAHKSLVELEGKFDVSIITQNVDDLHERAGSKNVIHIHGELLKSRSTKNEKLIYTQTADINVGDKCELGSQLRPHIVWFGENVSLMKTAIKKVIEADYFIIVGTSLLVYPAASLISYIKEECNSFYVDKQPNLEYLPKDLRLIKDKATVGIPIVVKKLLRL